MAKFYNPVPTLLPMPACVHWVLGSYWRPNPAFVSELAGFFHGKSVLEIFAGNGYLAGLMTERGVQVTATSILTGHDAHEAGVYHPIRVLSALDAVARHGATHDVLLVCWPTVTEAVLHAVKAWGPDKDIVFIGEITDYSKGHLGGCATDDFFEAITFTQKFKSYAGNMLEAAGVCRLNGPAVHCA